MADPRAPVADEEQFGLSLLGGALERRYRHMRPDVEALAWGTLDVSAIPASAVADAQRLWTVASFNEHCSAAAAADTLRALVVAGAPLDMTAVLSGFVLDELAHAEMCARIAMELGGAATLLYAPQSLLERKDPRLSPLLEAAVLVVRHYCVEESVAAPLLQAAADASTIPLLESVFQTLAKDEALHGRFGWMFLDWAAPRLGDEERLHLARVAARTIAGWVASWPLESSEPRNELGGLDPSSYRKHAQRALDDAVLAPLRARGITP